MFPIYIADLIKNDLISDIEEIYFNATKMMNINISKVKNLVNLFIKIKLDLLINLKII